MKKSKILIPALSIASVGAVVAPIVTSCAKTQAMVDLYAIANSEEGYKHRITPSTVERASLAKAAELYFGNANASTLIADDIYDTLANDTYLAEIAGVYLPEIYGAEVRIVITGAKGLITNASAAYETGKTFGRITGKISLVLESDVYNKDDVEETAKPIAKWNVSVNYDINSLAYNIYNQDVGTPNEHWNVGIQKSKAQMSADKKWSIVRSYMGEVTYLSGDDKGFVEKVGETSTWYYSSLPGTTDVEIAEKLSFLQWENINFLSNTKLGE